jgi:hypothetical protein
VWAHEAAGEAIGHLVEMQKHLDFLSMARHLGTNAPAMTISEILEREG